MTVAIAPCRGAHKAGALVIVALTLTSSNRGGAEPPPATPIVLETSTRAFTPLWEVALDDKARVQRRAVTTTGDAAWHLLPPGGVPVASARIEVMKELIVPIVSRAFESATRLTELSADGDNLIVVDDRRRVYYAKLGRDPARVGTWADVWGPPALSAPLLLPDDTIAWAISHRAQPYEDIDGNVHPISAGVTTLYALFPGDDAPDGQRRGSRIAYQDPWLPPPSTPGARWDREVCPPERGTLTLVSLAASASTIAVMDDAGRIHTRLADFDTLGHNPALPYSWKREKRVGLEENVRSLPPEDWRAQPLIPGAHGKDITIFFDGDGNAKRRLRVPGEQGEQSGYWEKALFDDGWRFVPVKGVPRPALGFVKRREATRHPPRGENLKAKIGKADVVVEDFAIACPGARVTLSRDDEEVQLRLWHTERLLELTPKERDLRGALLLEGEPKGKLADDVRTTFGGASVHEVEIDVSARTVEVKSAAANLQKMKRPLKVRLPRPRAKATP